MIFPKTRGLLVNFGPISLNFPRFWTRARKIISILILFLFITECIVHHRVFFGRLGRV